MDNLQQIGEALARLEAGLITKEQIGILIKEQIAVMQPSKAVFGREIGEDKKTAYGKQFKGFGDFIMAVANKDESRLQKTVVYANETTSADGGYAVPVEMSNMIIDFIQSRGGIARRLATVIPMTSKTRTITKNTAGTNVYWVSENAAKTTFKLVLDRVTQTAKKLTALNIQTEELFADESVGLDTYLMGLVANDIALEEDRVLLTGDVSGLSDPFNGLLYVSGATAITKEGQTLSADDLITQYNALNEEVSATAEWIMNTAGRSKVMKLKDNEGRPLFQMLASAPNGTLLGRPINLTSKLLNTMGTGAQSPIIFGDIKKAAIVSPRAELAVAVSRDASVWDGSASVSAFVNDLIMTKWGERISIDIVNTNAYNYILV